jgi:hypothetical protein
MRTVAVVAGVRPRRLIGMRMRGLVMGIGGLMGVRVALVADALVVMPERHA